MSLQATLARAEAEAAAERWLAHKRHCARCAYRARIRDWGWLCLDGARLREASTAAARDLAEARRLDKLPPPGQAALF